MLESGVSSQIMQLPHLIYILEFRGFCRRESVAEAIVFTPIEPEQIRVQFFSSQQRKFQPTSRRISIPSLSKSDIALTTSTPNSIAYNLRCAGPGAVAFVDFGDMENEIWGPETHLIATEKISAEARGILDATGEHRIVELLIVKAGTERVAVAGTSSPLAKRMCMVVRTRSSSVVVRI